MDTALFHSSNFCFFSLVFMGIDITAVHEVMNLTCYKVRRELIGYVSCVMGSGGGG
jgi:hypothetical protein